MILLDIWILTYIFILRGRLDESFLIVVLDGADKQDDVAVLDGRYHDIEDTDTDTDAFGIEVIAKTCRSIEGMAINLQLVVLLESLHRLLVVDGGVCLCEDTGDVREGIVDTIALDAVVLLDALTDIVHHLTFHLLIGGDSHDGNDEQYQQDTEENHNFSEATVIELLKE